MATETTQLGPEDQIMLALVRIKARVCGERNPNWSDDLSTTQSRLFIADLCDFALKEAERAKAN